VLHLTDGGADLVMEGRGPALGVLDDATYAQAAFTLAAADRLLLYSDGLIERRRSDLASGLDRLRSAVATAAAEPERLLDDVLAAMAPSDADDVTLLAVARTA
jgi:serine phosphatase RsbU (regulator of sigma subunit)